MRIVAAMSGGVDSSVVAGLLAEAGHEVIGVTLQLYDHGAAAGRKGACCAGATSADARDVADRLGIPHYVIDAEARFRDAVIEDFADSYAAGETPIPCVRCNQSVKFTDLLGLARDLGAEAMATGHYVRRVEGADGPELHRARDRGARPELVPVRDHARPARLQPLPARRHAGQGGGAGRGGAARPAGRGQAGQPGHLLRPVRQLCRPGGRLRPEALEPGDIVDRDGAVLGRHRGLAHYTVGQSKGLGGGQRRRRQAVLALDPATRRVTVGPRSAGRTRIALRDVNWLADEPDDVPLRGQAARARGAACGHGASDAGGRRGGAGHAGAGRARPGLRDVSRVAHAGRRLHLPAFHRRRRID